MSTQFVPAICPQCGARLTVDPTKDAAVCDFCDTPFIVDRAINQYNITIENNYKTENTYNVHVAKKGFFQSMFEYKDHQAQREYDEKLRKEERRRNGWKTFGLILLWIYCFPIMIPYTLYKKGMVRGKTLAIIIGAVVGFMFLSVIVNGGKSSKTTSNASTTNARQITADFNVPTSLGTVDDIKYQYPSSWEVETTEDRRASYSTGSGEVACLYYYASGSGSMSRINDTLDELNDDEAVYNLELTDQLMVEDRMVGSQKAVYISITLSIIWWHISIRKAAPYIAFLLNWW